jgi:hypothetical protein
VRERNQRSSGLDHPSIAPIGVPIATMAARIAPQWVSVFRSNQSTATQSPRSKSGSLAKFTAIRLASSLLSNLAADRQARLFFEIDIGELLSLVVADNEARGLFVNGTGRREAALRQSVKLKLRDCRSGDSGRIPYQP